MGKQQDDDVGQGLSSIDFEELMEMHGAFGYGACYLVIAEVAMDKRDSEHVDAQQQRQHERSDAPRERNEANQPEQEEGIEPRRPETMPRAEDDATTFARSPEFHDRVPKRD